jgi:hypothetical protein
MIGCGWSASGYLDSARMYVKMRVCVYVGVFKLGPDAQHNISKVKVLRMQL